MITSKHKSEAVEEITQLFTNQHTSNDSIMTGEPIMTQPQMSTSVSFITALDVTPMNTDNVTKVVSGKSRKKGGKGMGPQSDMQRTQKHQRNITSKIDAIYKVMPKNHQLKPSGSSRNSKLDQILKFMTESKQLYGY